MLEIQPRQVHIWMINIEDQGVTMVDMVKVIVNKWIPELTQS